MFLLIGFFLLCSKSGWTLMAHFHTKEEVAINLQSFEDSDICQQAAVTRNIQNLITLRLIWKSYTFLSTLPTCSQWWSKRDNFLQHYRICKMFEEECLNHYHLVEFKWILYTIFEDLSGSFWELHWVQSE